MLTTLLGSLGSFGWKFITGFMVKYFTCSALEKMVITLSRALAAKTESKMDDKLVEDIFGKLERKE